MAVMTPPQPRLAGPLLRPVPVVSELEGGLIRPSVEQAWKLPPRRTLDFDRAKYRRAVAKGLFFAFAEGPSRTLAKYRAITEERRMCGEQSLVVASIVRGGRQYVGLTRDLGGPLTFDTRLVFRATEPLDPTALELPERALTLLESYLPVPSCPVDPELPRLVLMSQPRLRPLADDTEMGPVGAFFGRDARGAEIAALARRRQTAPGGSFPIYLFGHGGYVRQYVSQNFPEDIAAAVDYRAALMRRHLSVDYPIFSSAAPLMGQIARDVEPLVIISTYHSDHASMAFDVLEANPSARVFIQKPAAVELRDIERLVALRHQGAWIDVGFNRRHAPHTRWLKEKVDELPRPLVISALVKEVKLPESHWYFWSNQGTRVTGNLCHWIDLAYHLVGSPPVELTMLGSGDNTSLTIKFDDGSIASILGTDRGDDLRGVEERIEVRGGDTTLTVDDFRRATERSGGTTRVRRGMRRRKGHAAMFSDLRERWMSGARPSYPEADLYWTGYMTWHAARLLSSGRRTHRVSLRPGLAASRL